MNLIVDAGNTAVKIAIFDDEELVFKDKFLQSEVISNLEKLLYDYPHISKVIISSVSSFDDGSVADVLVGLDVFKLTHSARFPYKNLYKTPETLGIDRLALASAAYAKYPTKNVLIIDAGTCITYDLLTSDNKYLGGAISPGLRLRYESLHNFTANLPLLNPEMPEDLIGNSTHQSIQSGVVNGLIFEIEGVIEAYKKKYSDLTVILTGGDCKFLSNRLKNGIFANSNFLLEGLNFILQHNKIK